MKLFTRLFYILFGIRHRDFGCLLGRQKTQSEMLKETQSVNANIDSLIKQSSHPNMDRLSKKK